MKIKILFLLLISIFSCQQEPETTTLYFVRHTEKDLTTKVNPKLTEAGIKRANDLAIYFSDKNIDKVLSTNYKRTISTASPTAKAINKEVIIYNTKTLNTNQLISNNMGKTVLIVGHSNTIPNLVNNVIKEKIYKEIDERI